jgi:hypothetical protein
MIFLIYASQVAGITVLKHNAQVYCILMVLGIQSLTHGTQALYTSPFTKLHSYQVGLLKYSLLGLFLRGRVENPYF